MLTKRGSCGPRPAQNPIRRAGTRKPRREPQRRRQAGVGVRYPSKAGASCGKETECRCVANMNGSSGRSARAGCGRAIALGSGAPATASQGPGVVEPSVSQRLAAIREAVSAVATPPGEVAKSGDVRLAWGDAWRNFGWGRVNPRGAPWGNFGYYRPWDNWPIGTIFGATGRAGLSLGRLREAACPVSICWLSSRRRFATSIADSATCPIAATRRSSPRRRSRGCSRSCSKPGGRIHQQTFVDTYAKLGFAKLYDRKTPLTAADLLDRPIVKTPLTGV